eukprot:COSAG01_NODE_9268_length_2498_cov_1.364318_1_plen_397_part_00
MAAAGHVGPGRREESISPGGWRLQGAVGRGRGTGRGGSSSSSSLLWLRCCCLMRACRTAAAALVVLCGVMLFGPEWTEPPPREGDVVEARMNNQYRTAIVKEVVAGGLAFRLIRVSSSDELLGVEQPDIVLPAERVRPPMGGFDRLLRTRRFARVGVAALTDLELQSLEVMRQKKVGMEPSESSADEPDRAGQCPHRCRACNAGDESDGGVPLVDGWCTASCSLHGFCGVSDSYGEANGGTACGPCFVRDVSKDESTARMFLLRAEQVCTQWTDGWDGRMGRYGDGRIGFCSSLCHSLLHPIWPACSGRAEMRAKRSYFDDLFARCDESTRPSASAVASQKLPAPTSQPAVSQISSEGLPCCEMRHGSDLTGADFHATKEASAEKCCETCVGGATV